MISFKPLPLHCRGKNPEPLNRWQGVGFIPELHALKKRQSVPQPGIEPARSLGTALTALKDVLCVCACACVCVFVCVFIYIYIYIYIYYMCLYVSVYVCMFVCTCTLR
jgi:hypothetical protein